MTSRLPQNHQSPSDGSNTTGSDATGSDTAESGATAAPDFVHLQVHSLYSPLESTVRMKDLFRKCQEHGMKAVAITDHGNMCGVIDFLNAAKATNVKPIFGCDVYVEIENRKTESRAAEDKLLATRLTLLAQNNDGYRELTELVSRSYLENRVQDRPMFKQKWFEKNGKNLIAIVGGLKSDIGWQLLRNREEEAEKALSEWHRLFGDRMYTGLQSSNLTEVRKINDWLIKKSDEQNIPYVAVGNVHYLEQEDASSHEVLTCIRLGRTIQDTGRRIASNDFWFKDGATINEEFSLYPKAITNSIKIANRCNVEFRFKDEDGKPIYHLPTFKIPEGETVKTLEDYLQVESERGLEWQFAQDAFTEARTAENWDKKRKVYYDRLYTEVEMIKATGFSGYFLIVSDFIRWSKEQGIPVGPGRGSGAGSIVAWALRITDIDPIPYNLLFERFINPERISMPDFDVDFCQSRREEVIEYAKEKYGREKVSQIITFGKLQTKNCIRDVGRVLGMPYGEVDQIAKLVPDKLGIKVQEALDMEPRFKELCEDNPIVKTLFDHALKLEGLIRNFGKHAGGVIITDKPLSTYSPLYADEDGSVMTQLDKDASEQIGLVKFDFLGLKTLTHIQQAVDLVNARSSRVKGEKPFRIEDISVDEKEPFDLISKGDTIGVFQVESSGMIELCKRIQPDCLDELTAINALYRPGPLESGMVEDFIERKHGRREIEYPAPQLEEVLKETFGVIVYQEQVMRLARVLASYSLGEADLLRRAMGKKKVEEMAAQKERFTKGAKELINMDTEVSSGIFDLIEKFAGYGFNKSHATAYAYISYQTAYLKYHYPAQFYAALLTTDMSDTDKLAKIIADAKEHRVQILGPDINESGRFFNVVEVVGIEKVRFGLEAIKNVGGAAVAAILEERETNTPYKSLADFCARVPLRKVNKKTLETLVRTGAFDQIYKSVNQVNRMSLFNSLEGMMAWGVKEQEFRACGQGSLFDGVFDESDGPGLASAEPEVEHHKDWTYMEKLETERELLGFYVSGHPLDSYASMIKSITTYSIHRVQELAREGRFKVDPADKMRWKAKKEVANLAGLVTYFREIMTKKGDRMAFATLEDLTGKIEIVCFPKTYAQFGELLKVGTAVAVGGNIEATEGVAKILASKIESLEDYSGSRVQKAQWVLFRLKEEDTSRAQLKALRNVLTKYNGSCRGVIEFSNREGVRARLRLREDLRFSPSYEFINDVRDIFGGDVLVFQ